MVPDRCWNDALDIKANGNIGNKVVGSLNKIRDSLTDKREPTRKSEKVRKENHSEEMKGRNKAQSLEMTENIWSWVCKNMPSRSTGKKQIEKLNVAQREQSVGKRKEKAKQRK